MIINDRQVITIQYSTEKNWVKGIPNENWLCVLVDNDRQRNYVDEVISKLLNNDVCYICTVGQRCEKNHDLIDEEIGFREVDIDDLYLPKHNIMTTWHTDFEEGLSFAFFAAHHDELTIDKVVMLDMTDGREQKRIDKLLDSFTVSK